MSQPVLVADGLQKFYGTHHALRGLSFMLDAGRILGFLGPNGAGKTTAIRILTTILEPSAGSFRVAGVAHTDPASIRGLIGVLPESNGFPEAITATEYLTYYGRLFGLGRSAARARAGELLGVVGLADRARSLVGSYSRGMRQRLGIARALINDPVLLFLDEPTLGLDPRGQRELLQLLKRIAAERGKSILITSHMLSEIEEICHDVIIMRSGEAIASGTVGEVINKAARSAIHIATMPEFAAIALESLSRVRDIASVAAMDGKAGWLQIEIAPERANGAATPNGVNNELLKALIDANVPIVALEGEGRRLQEAFLHLTEH